MNRPEGQLPAFYATAPHACSYLPDRQAVTVFADPGATLRTADYGLLAGYGFRRSGPHLYRPGCDGCRECVPVRVPVARFRPNRSQRRTARANADLEIRRSPLSLRDECFDLYRRYMRSRHPGSTMDDPDPAGFAGAFDSGWCETVQFEMWLERRLVGVAITDVLPDALSSVYTYFDPTLANRGLGTFAILHQIAAARAEARSWLYLGYWIAGSDTMRYKARFTPQQRLEEGVWRPFGGPPPVGDT